MLCSQSIPSSCTWPLDNNSDLFLTTVCPFFFFLLLTIYIYCICMQVIIYVAICIYIAYVHIFNIQISNNTYLQYNLQLLANLPLALFAHLRAGQRWYWQLFSHFYRSFSYIHIMTTITILQKTEYVSIKTNKPKNIFSKRRSIHNQF